LHSFSITAANYQNLLVFAALSAKAALTSAEPFPKKTQFSRVVAAAMDVEREAKFQAPDPDI